MWFALFIAAVLGCTSNTKPGCDGESDAAARDLCRFRLVVEATDPATAYAELTKVEDPIVRSAGVFEWLRAHPQAERNGALKLCTTLSSNEARTCDRRVSSEHLHR